MRRGLGKAVHVEKPGKKVHWMIMLKTREK